MTEGAKRLRSALSGASVTAAARRTFAVASGAFADSKAGRFVHGAKRTVRTSWLYRWLTAEPEPDVIVIDLRETAIVGPLLGVLDWFLVRVLTYGEESVASVAGKRGVDILRARPIQAMSTVVLAAVAASLAVVIAGGTPTAGAIGLRLLALSLALAGTRLRYSAEDLAETRVYSVLVALLEPPEPPESPRERRDDP
ncbi:hypothetical protein HTIA_0858 [Halorhabdus tiamatea SARL4B]|uniref:Uncharacterized protein n=1 Tax=Halorhabdus tiamatea SARL4B TaxID=1033806 RepID=F7PJ33_9EURY|nr:hypothetical protein HTIA_0858 [Halorhabdus tiamatea SARL4B]